MSYWYRWKKHETWSSKFIVVLFILLTFIYIYIGYTNKYNKLLHWNTFCIILYLVPIPWFGTGKMCGTVYLLFRTGRKHTWKVYFHSAGTNVRGIKWFKYSPVKYSILCGLLSLFLSREIVSLKNIFYALQDLH